MKDKVLLIRADANKEIGHGHVMQCIALAQEWQKRGGTVSIVSRELSTSLVDRLSEEHIDTYELTDGKTDAMKTAALATFLGAGWLVIDGHQFHANYRSVVIERAYNRVMAIVDGQVAPARVDIVLNQNSWAKPIDNPRGPYKQLMGSKYALLKNEFLSVGQNDAIKHSVTKVFVATGGTDTADMKERLSNIVANKGYETVIDYALMATSDMAISAGGGTCRELAYLGIPSILFTVADNQRRQVEDLSNRGVAISIGPAEYLTDWQIKDALRSLAGDKDRRKQMSFLGKELIDGRGAERVVKEMLNE